LELEVQLGWIGLVKTVAVTATLTSAAWIAAGAWWYQRYVERDPVRPPAQTASSPKLRYDAEPVAAPAAQLAIPVQGIRPEQLTDTFGDARSEGRRHDAIDIMAPLGTPVIAAAEGQVEKLFLSDAGGNTVYLRSPDRRTIYYYAHLDSYAPSLREGLLLRQRARIGSVGYTGNASPTAPHLHFAILATGPERKWWEPATAINPYPLLVGRR
jgi:murein DD-endopeptidase MepM/ murein hydrolase activator NlpD